MKNITALAALITLVISFIWTIYCQISPVEPWVAFVLSAGAVALAAASLTASPRSLSIFVIVSGIILSFWNYVVAVGGL